MQILEALFESCLYRILDCRPIEEVASVMIRLYLKGMESTFFW